MSATIQSAGCPAPAQDNKLLLWQRFIKGRGISYIVLAVIGIVWIFPFLWMALGSLKTQREILAKPPKLMPEHATLANFITVLGNMVFCSMVGYALAKMKFAGKNILFGAVMVTLMVPSVATFVPLFVIISNMHLANTYAALILPFLCQPIGVFLMRQFIGGIPDALMEAARVDGAGELRIFFQIILPQCGPALATLSILTFLSSWNKRGDVHAASSPVPLLHGPERHQLQCAARRRRASHHTHPALVRIPAALLHSGRGYDGH